MEPLTVSVEDRPPVEPYGWDWSATAHDARAGIVDELLQALGAETVSLGGGLHGWSQSVTAFDAGGYKCGAVYFGAARDDVYVLSTSHQAHDARAAVASVGERVRTSRVDTRVDCLVPYEELEAVLIGVAGPRTKVMRVESSIGGVSTGRTLYIGAPTSAVRVRLYEKHLESPGLYVEGTNRVEVQLRPPSRAKEVVTSWSPAETFCASKLTRRLAAELGSELAEPGTLQKAKATPDLQRSLEAMGHQYGPAVRKWLQLSGGDLGTVLDHLAASEPDRDRTGTPDL